MTSQSQQLVPQLAPGTLVLVTGASGFTGSVLVEKLVAQGMRVRAIARSSSNITRLQHLDIEWFSGNVYDPAVVAAAARDVEYIFHVAAAFRDSGIPKEEYRLVHVTSTELLAQAVLGAPQFKRFVHVSTMGVHGHIEHPPGDEHSPFAPGDEYQRTKADAEHWLEDFAEKHDLPYTIIRPTGIYGPGDRRLLKVFKMATLPLFPVLGSGKCLYHFIHVDDLTDAILLAAVKPEADGEAFLIGNTEAISIIDVGHLVARLLKRPFRVARIPAGPFFVLADLCELICKPLGISPPLYRRRVAFFTKDRSFDVNKMRTVLGFTPKYSNVEGMIQTAQWYLAAGWLHSREAPDVQAARTVITSEATR